MNHVLPLDTAAAPTPALACFNAEEQRSREAEERQQTWLFAKQNSAALLLCSSALKSAQIPLVPAVRGASHNA